MAERKPFHQNPSRHLEKEGTLSHLNQISNPSSLLSQRRKDQKTPLRATTEMQTLGLWPNHRATVVYIHWTPFRLITGLLQAATQRTAGLVQLKSLAAKEKTAIAEGQKFPAPMSGSAQLPVNRSFSVSNILFGPLIHSSGHSHAHEHKQIQLKTNKQKSFLKSL